jgi:hypothetical protein
MSTIGVCVFAVFSWCDPFLSLFFCSSKYVLDNVKAMHYHQTSDAKHQKPTKRIEKRYFVYFLEESMRTTLDIEEDVLLAAKEIARQKGMTVGRVLSDLARKSLTRKSPVSKKDGLPLFSVRPDAGIVTLELVNQLRDETP